MLWQDISIFREDFLNRKPCNPPAPHTLKESLICLYFVSVQNFAQKGNWEFYTFFNITSFPRAAGVRLFVYIL